MVNRKFDGQKGIGINFLLAASGMALSVQAASAQDLASKTDDKGEIVVTALKRSTTLQSTPISISAISGSAIANSGVQTIADLGATTPSLNFTGGGPSQRRVVIRGIQGSGEPLIGTYYDETPVTGMIGASADAGGSTPELRLFDVQRVEVLRGPQGTLYGSGSMGGTLRVIYNKPVMNAFEGGVDASLSDTDRGGLNPEASAMLNVPVVHDKIAVRVVGFYSRQRGYIDNTSLGINHIDDQKSYGGRFIVRLKPTDQWTIDLASYINDNNGNQPVWTAQSGKYISDALTRQPVRDHVELHSITSGYDLDFATLTASGSYMHRKLSTVSDISSFIKTYRSAAACAYLVGSGSACSASQLSSFYSFVDGQSTSVLFPQQEMDAWTAELRLSSNGHGPLNWTLGGFYANRDTNVLNPAVNADAQTGEVIYPLQVNSSRHIDDRLTQLAGFGEVSWDIARGLNLTAGARYFNYKKDVEGATTVASSLLGSKITPLTKFGASENGSVYKFNGSYKITPQIMVYAEAAQGFRPGGVNQVIGLDAALTPYKSDTLWNYEAGLKTSLFDRLLTFNIDAFQIDWKNMQITLLTPNLAFSYIGNAGKAKVQGVEAETTIRPVDGLSIMGNASYMNGRLTENQNTGVTATSGLKGDRIPYEPQLMAATAIQYNWPIHNNLEGFARLDAKYVGGSWSEFRPTYAYARYIGAYELANARIGVEAPDNHWGVYLFANNLFNATAITRAASSSIVQGRTLVNSSTPRTIGVNVRSNF